MRRTTGIGQNDSEEFPLRLIDTLYQQLLLSTTGIVFEFFRRKDEKELCIKDLWPRQEIREHETLQILGRFDWMILESSSILRICDS